MHVLRGDSKLLARVDIGGRELVKANDRVNDLARVRRGCDRLGDLPQRLARLHRDVLESDTGSLERGGRSPSVEREEKRQGNNWCGRERQKNAAATRGEAQPGLHGTSRAIAAHGTVGSGRAVAACSDDYRAHLSLLWSWPGVFRTGFSYPALGRESRIRSLSRSIPNIASNDAEIKSIFEHASDMCCDTLEDVFVFVLSAGYSFE